MRKSGSIGVMTQRLPSKTENNNVRVHLDNAMHLFDINSVEWHLTATEDTETTQ